MAHILVVVDETSIRTVLSVLVKSLGHEAVMCSNGEQAIDVIQSDQSIDVVMTDLRMNEVSGMDVIASVKRHRPQTPAIVISAYLSEEKLKEIRAIGAFGHIAKPFRMDAVRETIEAALSAAPLPPEE